MSSEWICGRHWMLTFLLGGLGFLTASASQAKQAVGGDDVVEPYVVYVAHEAVYARCGPDGEYYRTDPLRLGQELEVYLETEDGWLGIRPPENSFSWVPAEDIELSGDEQFGRVSGAKAVAWIGTHLGRARKYRWQVQLPRGEEVAVIGKTERQKEDGSETWYRIVPPSGEFRWIHRTQIAESPEQLVQMHRRRRDTPTGEPTPASPLASAPVRKPDQREADNGSDTDRQPGTSRERSILATEMLSAGDEPSAQETKPSRASDPIAELQAIDRYPIGSGLANTTDEDVVTDRNAVGRNSRRSSDTLNPAADVAMVVGSDIRVREIPAQKVGGQVKPPASEEQADDASWVTGHRPSRNDPIAMVDHTSPVVQDRAKQASHLQPTIPPVLRVIHHESPEEMEAVNRRTVEANTSELQLELSRQLAAGASAGMVEPIRQRALTLIETLDESVERGHARLVRERVEQYQHVARRRDGEPEQVNRPEATKSTPATSVQAASIDETPSSDFVRTGYLVQVFSARPQAPPYALNDASGRTLAYVSPALGVRLRGYLNRHVGLKGETKFDTGLNTPHIIASQAVPVQR